MLFMPTVDPRRVKYIDESHFVSADLYRSHAVGPIGERVMTVSNEALDGNQRLTMTLCTSLAGLGECLDHGVAFEPRHHPVWANVTYGGNTASNFAHTIFSMVESGFIAAGDIIILDNAKVSTMIQSAFDCTLGSRLKCSVHISSNIRIFEHSKSHPAA